MKRLVDDDIRKHLTAFVEIYTFYTESDKHAFLFKTGGLSRDG